MKSKTGFTLLLALVLVLGLFAGCDMRDGRVANSPDVTLIPENTPGQTPVVTDVPAPTATHYPNAAQSTAPPASEAPPVTTPPTAKPTANTTAAFGF